ncbi:regulatory protein RecX [Wenzhouxiangella marina]|uniref:Regulatory protein RecX n=1 Tax=Wenzhouxiangella marina TaxID=1579979 RepID=A0A0K0XVU4_9GAMM|nr:regulatory protein RecX [Wenzhouxiangella marina]AKS41736.1 Regulatory protein RecX [Wenzhouxiangella marina]MBB6086502.1 regulatory protein [Wenzhouxiangella marina]
MASETGTINPADLREAAVRLLARREHSARELVDKLRRKGWPVAEVEKAVSELAEQGLQSDTRYAESFVRSRVGKHYGPVRIRAELNERGVDRPLIDRVLREAGVDWFATAAEWYERRYAGEPPADFKDKGRRQQALARRGFEHSMVRELLD